MIEHFQRQTKMCVVIAYDLLPTFGVMDFYHNSFSSSKLDTPADRYPSAISRYAVPFLIPFCFWVDISLYKRHSNVFDHSSRFSYLLESG